MHKVTVCAAQIVDLGRSQQKEETEMGSCLLAGMTHWQSPNFFAYFPANSSFPGMLGEMLSAALNIVGFSWRGCPAATDLETVSPQITPVQDILNSTSKRSSLSLCHIAVQTQMQREIRCSMSLP